MKLKRPFTRLAIDARKTVGVTQEEAAALLNISPGTLQRYETDESRIPTDIVARMALVYHAPELLKMFCENECAIGCQDGPCEHERSTSDLLLELMLIDRTEVQDVVRTLRDILSDGVIDSSETAQRDRCWDLLDRIEKNAAALKLQIKRAEARR